jgi:predicted 3-demethylubiquinone-9 3-methyltransferase (glyoxalase superfamily)
METQIKSIPERKLRGTDLQTITPFLWFDNQAAEASNFYTSIFTNSKVIMTTRYGAEASFVSGMLKGSILTVAFQIEGQAFTAMNGGPEFNISPAISFLVNCNTLEKMDDLWAKLKAEGSVLMELGSYPFSERYGWVQDRYGVSWQLILQPATQTIAPCLLFTRDLLGKAEAAINFYTNVFDNSFVERIERYHIEDEGPTGAIKYAEFTLQGQTFAAMDSGRDVPFGFTPALSFVVNCTSQEEIDYYWDKLGRGGDENSQQCGWLKDRYNVSWQIVPVALFEMLNDPDSGKSERVMNALIKMKKLDLAVLRRVYTS